MSENWWIIIIGNSIAFLGGLLMVYVGFIKDRKKFIFLQLIQIILYILSNAVLGSGPGVITNTVSAARNYLTYKEQFTKNIKIITIILFIVLSIVFNNIGPIGFLPIVSAVVYTYFIDIKDPVRFKIIVIMTGFLWIIHDFYIKSYSSAIFQIFFIIGNIWSLYQIKHSRKRTTKKNKHTRTRSK